MSSPSAIDSLLQLLDSSYDTFDEQLPLPSLPNNEPLPLPSLPNNGPLPLPNQSSDSFEDAQPLSNVPAEYEAFMGFPNLEDPNTSFPLQPTLNDTFDNSLLLPNLFDDNAFPPQPALHDAFNNTTALPPCPQNDFPPPTAFPNGNFLNPLPPPAMLNGTVPPPPAMINGTFPPPPAMQHGTFLPPQAMQNGTFPPPPAMINGTFPPPPALLNSTFNQPPPPFAPPIYNIPLHPGPPTQATDHMPTPTPTPSPPKRKHRKPRANRVDETTIDMTDEAAVKRAKNTLAARRSRSKMLRREAELEARVAELEGKARWWRERALAMGHVA